MVTRGHYHAGSASDLLDVLGALSFQETRYGVFAIGYSLGGNILLNLLHACQRITNLLERQPFQRP